MTKFLIVLCTFIACAAAKPGVLAPFAAPLISTPLAAAAFNAPLDAAYASSRLDVNQRFAGAFVPTAFAAAPAKLVTSTPVATSLTAPFAAPLAAAPAKLVASASVAATLAAPVAAPLAYTNLPLDAAYASSRLDINQRYAGAVLPTAFNAAPAKLVAPTPVATPLAAPVAVPAKLVASPPVAAPLAAPVAAPLAYTNLPLDAAYASSRLDINQRYAGAFVPTAFAAAPAKLVAPLAAPVAAPAKLVASAPVAAPLAFTNVPLDAAYASSRLDVNQKYAAAFFPASFAAAPAKLLAPAAPVAAAPFAAPLSSLTPLKYTAVSPALW